MSSKRVVRIADLADERSIVSDVILEDCEIRGPGMLTPIGPLELSHCKFDGTFDSLFFEVEEGRTVIGVIGLERVAFRRCDFKNVGFIAAHDFIQKFGQDLLRDN
jgi:hypothetical protein